MTTVQQKGNALEAAVLAVEQLILSASPSVKEKTYRIESKKIINVGGVHHEIDLFVTFDLGPGYSAIFIFECKNWKDAVPKNEIIVFAEKIAASGAQRGFFVAKSFTADALAQAKKEPRMELVAVTEHDPASTIMPFSYHTTFTKPRHVKAAVKKAGIPGIKSVKIDLSQAVAILNGGPINLFEYINTWVVESMIQSMLTFPSGTLADGTYQRECSAERAYAEGAFSVTDNSIGTIPIGTATIDVQFDVYLVHPAIKSHFEINGRGRVISLEAHTVGDVTMTEVQFTFGPEQNA